MAFHSRWASAIRGSWICNLRAGSVCDERFASLKAATVITELVSEAASPGAELHIIQEVYSKKILLRVLLNYPAGRARTVTGYPPRLGAAPPRLGCRGEIGCVILDFPGSVVS